MVAVNNEAQCIYCDYWDTVWVSFCSVRVGICLLRRLCVYQVIVLYTSKKTPRFLLTVFNEAIFFCQEENQCAHSISKINFFHLDCTSFMCFIVCKQASHS